MYGPVGEFVRAAEPHTEADRAALYLSLLAALGIAIGKGPHTFAGNDRHPAALYVAVVGPTGKGAKGTSFAVVRSLMERVDPDFMATRVVNGFGSGEAVIDALAPRDGGPDDRRLLIYEPELARVLRIAARDGSILSPILRAGWDGGPLQARSRQRVAVAPDPHLGMVGHVTDEELNARLSKTDVFGGFANRFLFVLTYRARLIPSGGNVPADLLDEYGTHFRRAVQQAREVHRLPRTSAAEAAWARLYEKLGADNPGGLLGAATSRDASQCLRLSLLLALLDGADAIDTEHVTAAAALWRYCRESAAHLFAGRPVLSDADRLLAAVAHAGDEGLAQSDAHRCSPGTSRAPSCGH